LKEICTREKTCIFKEAYKCKETYKSVHYGVAMTGRLLEITSLFCRISSLLLGSFAKETHVFREPTHCSHPISSHDVQISCLNASKEPLIVVKRALQWVALLQKSPMFLGSLPMVATPYQVMIFKSHVLMCQQIVINFFCRTSSLLQKSPIKQTIFCKRDQYLDWSSNLMFQCVKRSYLL